MDKVKPWYAPRSPDEILPYPWLHPHAVEYFEEILQPTWTVLEHGAGGSTLWLAERVKQVTSIEHDPYWRRKVRELAPDNVKVLSLKIADGKGVLACGHDLFFIDGDRLERGTCLAMVDDFVMPGGWIVLDNANRPEYAEQREQLKSRAKLKARFNNNIPGSLYFITEFWQCEPE